MDHLRPYYRMASDNVHPNAHGAFYRMGMGLDGNDRRVLLAGASNMGLADPGHGTAMSTDAGHSCVRRVQTDLGFSNRIEGPAAVGR